MHARYGYFSFVRSAVHRYDNAAGAQKPALVFTEQWHNRPKLVNKLPRELRSRRRSSITSSAAQQPGAAAAELSGNVIYDGEVGHLLTAGD